MLDFKPKTLFESEFTSLRNCPLISTRTITCSNTYLALVHRGSCSP